MRPWCGASPTGGTRPEDAAPTRGPAAAISGVVTEIFNYITDPSGGFKGNPGDVPMTAWICPRASALGAGLERLPRQAAEFFAQGVKGESAPQQRHETEKNERDG